MSTDPETVSDPPGPTDPSATAPGPVQLDDVRALNRQEIAAALRPPTPTRPAPTQPAGPSDGHSASGYKRLAPSSLSPLSSTPPLLSQAQRPTLPQLISLPTRTGERINIIKSVGTQYTILGLILLNDQDGSLVGQITPQYQLNAVNITREIMRRWIRGEGKQPVTWKTLIDALTVTGLTELAKSILESVDL